MKRIIIPVADIMSRHQLLSQHEMYEQMTELGKRRGMRNVATDLDTRFDQFFSFIFRLVQLTHYKTRDERSTAEEVFEDVQAAFDKARYLRPISNMPPMEREKHPAIMRDGSEGPLREEALPKTVVAIHDLVVNDKKFVVELENSTVSRILSLAETAMAENNKVLEQRLANPTAPPRFPFAWDEKGDESLFQGVEAQRNIKLLEKAETVESTKDAEPEAQPK